MTTENSHVAAHGSRRWILAVGLLLSVLGVWYALGDVDFGALARQLAATNLFWFALGLAFMYAALMCRSLRWRVLLWPVARVGVVDINAFSMIGQMMNALLPAKLGEVARTALVAGKYRVSFAAVLSIVAADRLLDMAGLALLALALPLYFPVSREVGAGIGAVAVAFVAGVVVLGIIMALPDGAERAGLLVTRVLSAVLRALGASSRLAWAGALGRQAAQFLGSFRDGLRHLRDPRRLAISVLYTIGGWFFATLYAMCVFAAVGVIDKVPLGAGLVITIITNLSSAAPSTPGYWGVYEAAAKAGLELMHVDPTMAVAFAILAHSMWYLGSIVAGALALIYEGVSLSDVRKMAG